MGYLEQLDGKSGYSKYPIIHSTRKAAIPVAIPPRPLNIVRSFRTLQLMAAQNKHRV